MDSNINTDHIINLLLSTARPGQIAEDFRDEIEAVVAEILEVEDVPEALDDSITAFVDAIIDVAMISLEGHDDDRRLVGSMLGTAYATGISLGIAIGTLAAKAAEG